MIRFAILITAGLMMVLGAGYSEAQGRDGRSGSGRGNGSADRSPNRGTQGHGGNSGSRNYSNRSGYHGGHYGHGHGGRYYGGYYRPYYGYRYGYPYYPYYGYAWASPYYWGYPAYAYGGYYPAPAYYPYEQRPVYVERAPSYNEREVEPPHYEYRERLAQSAPPVEPAKPAPQGPPPVPLERYTLSATELFEFDKSVLKLPQPKLDEIAEALVRNPQINQVNVAGYTDRIGSEEYNLNLSKQRADAVKQYLVGKGVAPDRLIAIGRGEANPKVQCDDKDQAMLIKCLEPNRRVEVEQITVERPSSTR